MFKKTTPTMWNDIKNDLMKLEINIFGKDEAFKLDDFSTFKNPNAYNIIVYNKNKMIGYMMSQKLSESGLHQKLKNQNTTLYLESIGILEQYRGKGLGRKLMQKLISHGALNGYKHIILDTKEYPMLKMAEKYGFKKIRFKPHHTKINGHWIGAWVMIKNL